jgi:bifunctional DNase/RNase
MELHRIVIRDDLNEQIIILKEVDGERKLPMMINTETARTINRRLNGDMLPRPMTHDLLASVIEQMGGKITQIEINNLQDRTFFALIHIERDGVTVEVDSRPSDAIAVGVTSNVPIFVADHVLDEAG